MTVRILLFGDSITYGVYDPEGGWATRLVRDYLRDDGADPSANLPSVYNLGFSGDTTAHLAGRLASETNNRRDNWGGRTDFVLVLAIGINDSVIERGEPFSTPERYAEDLQQLYKTATNLTPHVLLVGLTPVIDRTAGAYIYNNDRIWQFEQVLRKFAQTHNVPMVAVYEAFKERLDAGETLLHPDQLHPNSAGHQLLYELIKPPLYKMVEAAQ